MGEKVFYYKIATKKCFCFYYYREKNWKKFRSIKYYRARGGMGAFQVIYLSNILFLFYIVLTLVSPRLERIFILHLSNMFYICRVCSTSVEYMPADRPKRCYFSETYVVFCKHSVSRLFTMVYDNLLIWVFILGNVPL